MHKEFDVVLYHSNCYDGFCSAWVFHTWEKFMKNNQQSNVKFIPVNHGNPVFPEECKDSNVLMLDICYKQSVMDTCPAKHLVVLDHHKTSVGVTVPSEKGTIIIDEKRSGCQLTYDYFYGDLISTIRHPLIEYIGRRDLWIWDLPHAKEITSYIYSLDMTFDNFDKLYYQWNTDQFIYIGSILLNARQKEIQAFANEFQRATFKNYKTEKSYNVLLGDCPYSYRSDVGSELMEKNPDIDFVLLFTYKPKKKVFSVSVRGKDKVDLTEIAGLYNGGGHPNASAFSCVSLDFCTFPESG